MIRVCLVTLFAAALPAVAAAQPYVGSDTPHRGTLEIGGGVVWTRGYEAGSAVAAETRPGSGLPLTLFSVSSEVLDAPGAGAQLGIYLGRRVSVEAAFQYSRPILRASVTSDFEGAPDTDADEKLTTYVVGGSLLYHFGTGRFVPFVSGGGGYLRQLHEENSDLLTGTDIHAGGGVKYWLGTGTHRFGLRVDAQASARSKSVAFEQKRRIVPTFAAGLSYLF
jgi:Outer membrane protein beta-barrel domain